MIENVMTVSNIIDIDIRSIIPPAFLGLFDDVCDGKYREYLLRGGRGSGKSTTIAIIVIFLLLTHKYTCAVAIMKQQVRLRYGAFALYRDAISILGLDGLFKISLSPMVITFKPTGQFILFRGLDEAGKTKGIATGIKKYYFAFVHFEELDQFYGMDEVNESLDSIVRGGDKSCIFYCYNPPANKFNWCNEWSHEIIEGRFVHYSSYLDMPKELLGQAFIDRAEAAKEYNEKKYRNVYLGEETGTDGCVFENLEERTITDEEIKDFNYIFQGFDDGWFPDPSVFVRLHYDYKNRTIYILDEIKVNKTPIAQIAAEIARRGYNNHLVTIDNHNTPEVVDTFRKNGVKATRVHKGSGSVAQGIEWLADRKIVVDGRRTPYTYKELREYEYARNRDGEYIGGYPDFNNHAIDAIRYALIDSFIRKYPEKA